MKSTVFALAAIALGGAAPAQLRAESLTRQPSISATPIEIPRQGTISATPIEIPGTGGVSATPIEIPGQGLTTTTEEED